MSPSGTGDWRIEQADAERRMELARKSFDSAGLDHRSWTGWKVTAAIIALVAAGTLLLNWIGSAVVEPPLPQPTPSVVTVSPG